ncbi:MAG: cbb3-type cytochrome c oxidase subunit I [Anaerolineae bacterium]|jgi:cytochrome c oxidase subunit 1|nr:cbb3-type cytochrome c oxidase subunit I [Anaerolineae bacterium]MDX9828658.1 cbb3-type cytochrome c oxidase subunit I [Anaerolineae bacterium]
MAQLGWQEKWTLRFAVVGLLFLALSGFEGLLMRTQQYDLEALVPMEGVLNTVRMGAEPTQEELYFSMMSAHPIVGIYGFVYMAIMGAFYFLVPYLVGKEVRYKKLVPINFALQPIGVMICWAAGFFGMFNALYTLYWPLPVSYDRVPLLSSIAFMIGAAIIMVNILLFAFNLFSTVLSKNSTQSYSFWGFLRSAFGIKRLLKWLGKEDKGAPNLDHDGLPVFLVAVGRGSIDTVINAFVLLTAGVLILVYGLAALFNSPLDPLAVNALVYKNWFWWGLDMVADGNVLIYTAGIWYLLIPMLVGRELFGAAVVKTVIMVDLLVSMGVWSHHLLADTRQPTWMKLLSGQFITWGEFFTMGLTIFASLMTIWLARPVKMTPALKFVLASIFGFIMGGTAGLIQANTGLNLVFHNTQWVIALHAHTFLLTAVSSLVFAVLYALVPMLTKKEFRFPHLVNAHLWIWIVGAVLNAYAMGMAGSRGMLRRTLYEPGMFQGYVGVAWVGGVLMGVGLVLFLVNVIGTLGLGEVIGLFVPDRWRRQEKAVPARA